MKVYHGSDTLIETVDLSKCKPSRDFGQGFYVTNLYNQARQMAQRVADWNKTSPIITEFDFDDCAFEDDEYKTLRFSGYDEKWLDFVIANRANHSRKSNHDYDIIEGPVADDAVSIRIKDYLNGAIDKETFLEELKYKKTTHQICFCTDKSLQMLQRQKDFAGNIYHIDDWVVQQLMMDYHFSDTQASDLYFNSKTYARLIDERTELYQKPWLEIFDLLIKELKF
ncbi:MAG: DUF3990 domain-containing protein [Dysgonamonadaceae bacterium]|jgi:hypothetical protein|nr:DUF3990 domain-containing protein [Dysgonamonadaceae bacterium]